MPLVFASHYSKQSRDTPPTLAECLRLLDVDPKSPESFPFVGTDVSAGCENELQVAVVGKATDVDLPDTIISSRYYANIKRRIRSGDTATAALDNLQSYLSDNTAGVWENSWVRFPCHRLNKYASAVINHDLRADKNNPGGPARGDIDRFTLNVQGNKWFRLPISYLLKLSLADVVGTGGGELVRATATRIMPHFISDNTSPETTSFHVLSNPETGGVGNRVAREAAKRFLLSTLLLTYANKKFGLQEHGQKAMLFFSPHPPIRQRQLNECISDAFYRELFMSPCLSGWNRGEKKQDYMALCHQVLSRSHLNGVMKLREAGIITNNLVILPQTSNVGLANNGTHISLGSKKLTNLLRSSATGFGAEHEKYLGDLHAKIMEHFLPLFVGTYSADPYRFDYEDFHPEKLLGFLPHQLDYTHLRMLWRRWRKKAKNRVFGHSLTPFGPPSLDRFIRRMFGLRGDFIADFRLLDYPVSLLSTRGNNSQDGTLGNDDRLKKDLHSLGLFDKRMSLYQLIRLRQYNTMGFSGFESRYYSQFHNFTDMKEAANLQMLIGGLAYKYIITKQLTHADIPATPFIESERRQIMFGLAVSIPTFFIAKKSRNRFWDRILPKVKGVRTSRRYPDYLRVGNREYLRAMVALIRQDGADLIDIMGMEATVNDLENRLNFPQEQSANGKLSRGILKTMGEKITPFHLSGEEFNSASETFYRQGLRHQHIEDGFAYLAQDIRDMASGRLPLPVEQRAEITKFCGGLSIEEALTAGLHKTQSDKMGQHDAINIIRLILLAESFTGKGHGGNYQ